MKKSDPYLTRIQMSPFKFKRMWGYPYWTENFFDSFRLTK